MRLLLGVACLQFFWVLVTGGRDIATVSAPPSHPALWLGALAGLYVFSYVVNIGLTLDLGRWPQAAVALIALSLAALGWGDRGVAWTPLLGWFVVLWLVYTFGHLGISFVLSGLLATPGCEMRAIPHLLGKITGRRASEHFCPGPLRHLDEWELRRAKS